MALAVGDSYACDSGGVIAAGRSVIKPNVAVIGDSISTELYGLSSAYWATALSGGKMNIVAQCGVGGSTIGSILARIDNSYLNASPGLAGITDLGNAFLRVGTNDAWANTPYASLQANFETLATKIANRCANRVYLLSVPPMGGPSFDAYNFRTLEYNAAYAAYAAAHSEKFAFVDDTALMRNGDGSQKPEYFHTDRLHLGGGGMFLAGSVLADILTPRLVGLPCPIETAVNDIYPAGNEWHANPLNVGTGGVLANGATGQFANGWTATTNFSGTSVACSKVTADPGDPNQTPWQRLTFNTVQTNGFFQADSVPVGRDLTTNDPSLLEGVMEFRLVGLDQTKFQYMEVLMPANTGDLLLRRMRLDMGVNANTNKQGVLRHKVVRSGSNDPASASIRLYILCAAAGSNVGSIDFRNLTIRG